MNILKSFLIVGCMVFVAMGLSGLVYAGDNNIVMETGINKNSIVEINRTDESVKLQGLIPEETQRGSMSISGLGHFGHGLNVGELLDTTDGAFLHVKTPSTSMTGLFESPVSNVFRLKGGKQTVELTVWDGTGAFSIRKVSPNFKTWITAKNTGEVGIGAGGELARALLHVSPEFNDKSKDLFLVSDGFSHGGEQEPGKEHLIVKTDGNVGISTADPKSKLQVTDGDVYVESIGKGIILRSEDGSCFRVTVKNDGTFASTSLACP